MITFIISGIWHGAALTFIVWGVLQGMFLSFEALTRKRKIIFEAKYNLSNKRWYLLLGICFTFNLFAASQIFGRAANIGIAFEVFQKIITFKGSLFVGSPSTLIFSFIGLMLLLLKDFTDEFTPRRFRLFESKNKLIRITAYSTITIIILLIGVFDGGEFIYFQF